MLSLFDIVIVRFAFEDRPNVTKPRPAIVVGFEGELPLLVLAKVTGHAPRPEYPGEVKLLDWEQEGLAMPSVVRCSKLVCVEEEHVRTLVGHLSDRDAAAVVQGLAQVAAAE